MRITVGGILFNSVTVLGEVFFKQWLKHIYRIGDEIILVEGAVKPIPGVKSNSLWASTDGKSTDNTIEVIKNFPDPDKKIKLIESNGFWNGKVEMCNQWAKHATGSYIWQIDNDEYYLDSDIRKLKDIM